MNRQQLTPEFVRDFCNAYIKECKEARQKVANIIPEAQAELVNAGSYWWLPRKTPGLKLNSFQKD